MVFGVLAESGTEVGQVRVDGALNEDLLHVGVVELADVFCAGGLCNCRIAFWVGHSGPVGLDEGAVVAELHIFDVAGVELGLELRAELALGWWGAVRSHRRGR